MQATTTSQMEERQPLLQSSPDRTSSKSLRSSRPPRSRTQSSRSVTSPLSPNAPSSSANAVVPTAPPEASLTHHIFRFLGYFVSFTPVMLSVALSVGILAGAKRIIVGASFGGAKASEKRGVFANTGYGAIDTPSGSTENLAAGRSSVSSARGGSGDDPTPIGSRRGPGSSHSSMYTNVTTLGSTTVDGKTLQISKFSIVRTPEETFDSVRTEWGYRYHYFKVAGVRVGFVDEGRGNKVVVCVHGATTWGYLYRKVVPKLVEQGLRVVVIDLPGHGKSDKLTSPYPAQMILALQSAALRLLLTKLVIAQNAQVTVVGHGSGCATVARAVWGMREYDRNVEAVVGIDPDETSALDQGSKGLGGRLQGFLEKSAWYLFGDKLRLSSVVALKKGLDGLLRDDGEVEGIWDLPYKTWHHASIPRTLLTYQYEPKPSVYDPLSDDYVPTLRDVFKTIPRGGEVLSSKVVDEESFDGIKVWKVPGGHYTVDEKVIDILEEVLGVGV